MTIITNQNTKKKILFYDPFALWPFHLETNLELFNHHVETGDDVTILVCNADLESCEPNHSHDRTQCRVCFARRNNAIDLLGLRHKVTLKPLKRLNKKDYEILNQYRDIDIQSLEQLKYLKFGECDIGMGVLSSLISYLREPNPDVIGQADFIKKNINSALLVYLSLINHLENLKPDLLYVFNGRFASLRPALRAAQLLGIDVQVHERAGVAQRYSLTNNTYPHDLENSKKEIYQHWESSSLMESEKIRIGQQWFQDRRSGDPQAWISFTSDQKNILPESFNSAKTNIVIFNSSEDEFCAIEEWRNPVYRDQNCGILKIVKDLEDESDLEVYLRVHPNLKGVKNSQTSCIESMKGGYKHFYVIDAESPISSYKLLDTSDLVITFSSTIGVEASYYGKPVLLLGRSIYEDLEACTQVKSHQEAIDFIRQRKFSMIDKNILDTRKINSTKYGFYMSTYGFAMQLFCQLDSLSLTYQDQYIKSNLNFLEKLQTEISMKVFPLQLY